MDTQREDFFDDRLFLLKYTFKFNTILNSCFGWLIACCGENYLSAHQIHWTIVF